MDIPIEIFQLILDHSDFLTKIRLRCVSTYLHVKLEICDFYHIDRAYSQILTDDILRAYAFITKLNAGSNEKITNVNHLTRLEILNAYGKCGINNQGITGLKLKKLCCGCNPRITSVDHMSSSLKKLDAESYSGIDDKGIASLNIIILNASFNPRITNISHMTNLKTLYVYDSGISDEHIESMGLKNLDVWDVPKLVKMKYY
jgi:hypothetical protein